MIAFKQRLSELRGTHRLTVKQLAETLGVSRQTIAAYEKGDSVPDIILFAAMTDYFNVSADYLLGREDYAERNKTLPLPQGFKDHNTNLMLEIAQVVHRHMSDD